MIRKKAMLVVFLGIFLAGCAAGPPPVREGLKENLNVPAGHDRRESVYRDSLSF